MQPSLIGEKLALVTELAGGYFESQSLDKRPDSDDYFATVRFEEPSFSNLSVVAKGPRITTIAVHIGWDISRDFGIITSILNKIDSVLLPVEQEKGNDGLNVTMIRRLGRSGNLMDEGWKTISRTATYGVLYDEYAA